ncbi:hypothetical protein Droror1_Dr00006129 [Drosera rotundifolia]
MKPLLCCCRHRRHGRRRCSAAAVAEAIIEGGPDGGLESYIGAIDQLRACRHYFAAEKGFEDAVWVLGEIDYFLIQAMLRIEDEFTSMLQSHREYLSKWHMENLTSLESSPRAASRKSSIDFDEQDTSKDSAYGKPLTPNPPPVLLHKLAHQLVQGGHQEQVVEIISYRSTLEQVLKEFNDVSNPDSHLASLIEGLLQDLQNNLERKSKQYNDPTLAQIFLMNNIHRVVQFVRRSEVMDLLGDDGVNQHWKIFQGHADIYREIS